MAKSLLIKSLHERLQLLIRPIVWVPSSVFTVLCLGIWQYYAQQPSEIGQLEPSSVGDPSETDSSALSEIDTLELLLESSRGVANPTATDRQTAAGLPSDLALTAPTGQAITQPFSQSSDQSDPFAAYRSQYQFQSGSNAKITDPISGIQPASGGFDFGTGLVNPTAPNTNSALSDALKRQQAASGQNGERNGRQSSGQTEDSGEVSPNQLNPQSGDRTNPTGSRTTNAAERNQPVSSLDHRVGDPTTAPYTSTNLNMSPPVGTTGYQLPNTVPLPNTALPTTQPSGNLSPTSIPLSPPAALAVPAAPATNAPGVLYTPPTFTQPDQGRPINPRQ